MTKFIAPLARSTQLLIRRLDDETLIVNLGNHEVSCLNNVLSTIWQACDGQHDIDALVMHLHKMGFIEADEAMVIDGLEQLDAADLLEVPANILQARQDISRREILRTIAKSAVTLPVLTTIMLQQPLAAASCIPNGQACSPLVGPPCCKGSCLLKGGLY